MGIVGYSRFRCRINGFNVYKMRNNNHQQGHYQNGNRQDNRKMEIVNVKPMCGMKINMGNEK
jgi:hypothetical protein